MNSDDIPDECLNDPQFVQILTATLVSEYETNDKLLKELAGRIKILKATVTKEIENRKNIKQQIKERKNTKMIIEPTLEHLSSNECNRITNLNLLKNRLDEVSLRKQIIQTKYKSVLETYRETWNNYEAEYEQIEYAVIRKRRRIEVKKLKIQFMVKQYKRLNYYKMLKQINNIYSKRIQTAIIASSVILMDIWRKQKHEDTLNNNINNSKKELQMIEKRCNEIRGHLDAKAETKVMARQQIPFPKINISLVRSLYVDGNPQNPKRCAYKPRQAIDLDTISVNTVIYEEMCKTDERIQTHLTTENHELEYDNKIEPHSSFQQTTDYINDIRNPIPDPNVGALENSCSQLSINEETCDNQSHENVEIEPQAITHSKSQPSCEKFPEEVADAQTSELLDVNSAEQQKEQMNISEVPNDTPSIYKNNTWSELKLTATDSSSDKKNLTTATIESLPQIKKIETVMRPITVQIKPPMAEVPPTPSSLFSPRHYIPSYGSSGNLSHYLDSNFNDSAQEICDLDKYSENWQNLTPPQGGSDISYASAHCPIKDISNNDTPDFINPPEKPASNFLNFFHGGTTKSKNLF